MKTLLRIDSSLRSEGSYSRDLGSYFVNEWRREHPNGTIIRRDVTEDTVPHLNQQTVIGFYDSAAKSALLDLSDRLIGELYQCDEILITTPMYNFGIPSLLKSYFDLVIRTGKTFRYEDEAIGLLKNKKAYIITAMGDVKIAELSLAELHLRQMLNYIGITDLHYFAIDGTADEAYVVQKIESQKNNITNKITEMEAIKSAVEAFVRGGDNRDVAQLERILHPAFQNIQDGFFDEKGIFVISKTNYIELVKTKKFGGNPRSIEFVHVELIGNIALVKAILESEYLKFHSTILCVCENDRWQVISNVPKIEVK